MTQNVNLHVDLDAPEPREPSQTAPQGETAQDRNFSDLGGFRPRWFPYAPELLNTLSILADSATVIRKVFLPLRKFFQIAERGGPTSQLARRKMIGDDQRRMVAAGSKKGLDGRTAAYQNMNLQLDRTRNQILAQIARKSSGGGKSRVALGGRGRPPVRPLSPPRQTPALPPPRPTAPPVAAGGAGAAGASGAAGATGAFVVLAGVVAGVAIGIAVLGLAAWQASKWIKRMAHVTQQFIERVRPISGEVQRAEAFAEVRSLIASIRENRRAGRSAAMMITAQNKLSIQIERFQSIIVSELGGLVSQIIELVARGLEMFNNLLEILSPFFQSLISILESSLGVIIDILTAIFNTLSEFVAWVTVGLIDLRALLAPKPRDPVQDALDGLASLSIFGYTPTGKNNLFDGLKAARRPGRVVP